MLFVKLLEKTDISHLVKHFINIKYNSGISVIEIFILTHLSKKLKPSSLLVKCISIAHFSNKALPSHIHAKTYNKQKNTHYSGNIENK